MKNSLFALRVDTQKIHTSEHIKYLDTDSSIETWNVFF